MSVENRVRELLANAIAKARDSGRLVCDTIPPILLEAPANPEHGDLATNIAMVMARAAGQPPRAVAQLIVDQCAAAPDLLCKTSVAGPGFINFTIAPQADLAELAAIEAAGDRFGRVDIGRERPCQIEFVSANPTGPLHVGHGRGAIYGDVLANLLSTAGYRVTKEYYLNDAGVQMQTLGRSVYLRLEQLRGRSIDFPPECYQGEYVTELARAILAGPEAVALQQRPHGEQISWCGTFASRVILDQIRADLAACAVTHDTYFRESSLHAQGAIAATLAALQERGALYEQEGALWFRSTAYGDDKDRVVRKSDGTYTYFAADIAYHDHKFRSGFARVIDIWGADHAGHVARMKAAMQALGHDAAALDCVLLQIVNLVRDGETVAMSTRRAEYETLRDLVREVGKDVCRYFFLMRSHTAQLDFDMGLATTDTLDNPVYYIQYAHARICSIFAKGAGSGEAAASAATVALDRLTLPEEAQLARLLTGYPTVIATAAETLEPHRITYYLLEVARKFQAYYAGAKRDPRYRVLGHDAATTAAKLYLLKGCRIVLQNALRLLGLQAPERMARLAQEDGADG